MAITVAQVRQIAKLPTNVAILPDANVQNYIDAATVMYGDIPAATRDGWTTEKQNLVQLYLAAHFAVISEEYGGFSAQVVGTSEERYQTDEGRNNGLATTRFGKTAIAFDNSGYLGTTTASTVKALFRVYDIPSYPPCTSSES